uniref:Uncharacterized protein n=1 Tax=viral metagenome TaxID=1070528 RepID=A0A6H1Z682_9ZZZZ
MASNRGTNRSAKLLVGALIMCLGLYPAAELTRVIWAISYVYDPSRMATWILETVIIWLLYSSIIPAMIYFGRLQVGDNPPSDTVEEL